MPPAPGPSGNQYAQPQKDQFASNFAKLQAREKQLRDLEMQLKERGSRVESLENAFKQANEDPFKLLESLNLDVERLYEVKKGGKFAPGELQVRQLKSELDKLREQVAQKERAEYESKQRAEQERQLAEFRQGVAKGIESKESYELTRLKGGVDDVLQVMADHFQQTSEMLDLDSALNVVERRYEEEVKRLMGAKKAQQWFREQLGSQRSEQQSESYAQPSYSADNVTTLTSSMASRTEPRSEAVSEEERFRHAVELLKGRRA